MENKYKNGKIYRIVCNVTGLTYIGSTYQTLSQRLIEHRGYYRELLKNPDKKNIQTSTRVIAGGDYDIVLLEKCPCESKEELNKRKRHYIESMECINKIIPGRSVKEYKKIYYEKNKEAIAEKAKIYREKNKEKAKIHRDKNKEAIAEKGKIYYEKNREAIAEKNKVMVECSCGSTHLYVGKARHLRSQTHREWAETQ
jgi:hypothetical protein